MLKRLGEGFSGLPRKVWEGLTHKGQLSQAEIPVSFDISPLGQKYKIGTGNADHYKEILEEYGYRPHESFSGDGTVWVRPQLQVETNTIKSFIDGFITNRQLAHKLEEIEAQLLSDQLPDATLYQKPKSTT